MKHITELSRKQAGLWCTVLLNCGFLTGMMAAAAAPLIQAGRLPVQCSSEACQSKGEKQGHFPDAGNGGAGRSTLSVSALHAGSLARMLSDQKKSAGQQL